MLLKYFDIITSILNIFLLFIQNNSMKTSTKILIVLFFITLVGCVITSSYLFSAINITADGIFFNMSILAYISLVFSVGNMIIGNILYVKFLKTRKFNSMLFFSTAPLMLSFGVLTFLLATINSYNTKPLNIVKTALNISTTNNNNYYWLAIVAIVAMLLLFITFLILTRPIKKVEKATKRLSYGETRENISIGGNRQFLDIEHSLNKINDNYKKKDEVIKRSNMEYEKVIPKQILKFFGKRNISDLEIGSKVKKTATTLFCNIRNSGLFNQTISLEENFNYINSYLNVVSPIIRKNGGFVDKYLDDGLTSVFATPQSAIACALAIIKTVNQKNLETNNLPNLDIGIGIHTSEIIFGIVGDNNKKTPTIISNSVNIASKMDDINKVFGSCMIVSKHTLKELPSTYKFSYRYMANLSIVEPKEVIEVFECLDVYPKIKKDRLNKYHTEFENGVRAYINGKYEMAKNIFETVYHKEKDDKVCYVYYNKCCESLGNKVLNIHE